MNTTQTSALHETITINFTGQIVLSRAVLQELLQPPLRIAPLPAAQQPKCRAWTRWMADGKLPRLAYTMQETAEILGTSYITVWRLTKRGLLRSSAATRTKMISRKEIERFLESTTAEI